MTIPLTSNEHNTFFIPQDRSGIWNKEENKILFSILKKSFGNFSINTMRIEKSWSKLVSELNEQRVDRNYRQVYKKVNRLVCKKSQPFKTLINPSSLPFSKKTIYTSNSSSSSQKRNFYSKTSSYEPEGSFLTSKKHKTSSDTYCYGITKEDYDELESLFLKQEEDSCKSQGSEELIFQTSDLSQAPSLKDEIDSKSSELWDISQNPRELTSLSDTLPLVFSNQTEALLFRGLDDNTLNFIDFEELDNSASRYFNEPNGDSLPTTSTLKSNFHDDLELMTHDLLFPTQNI
jgi:hypothetical protein